MFQLGHLSDLHATPMQAGLGSYLNKRVLGLFSRRILPSRPYRPEIVDALAEDLREQALDHIAITGDLTNVSLEQEFEAAATMLRKFGDPLRISLVPGNHDAYVPVPYERSWALWSEYIDSDPGEPSPGGCGDEPRDRYPTVRVRGRVALIGLCSAIPTPLFMATGELGAPQIDRLESLLTTLRARDLVRVVIVHHPPTNTGLEAKRRLKDAVALRGVLARAGAELVLHGHRHRTSILEVAGPNGPIPSIGVRSSSHAPDEERKRSQYHIYGIDSHASGRTSISLRTRGWDAGSGRFIEEEGRVLSEPS